jgi:hypothetical protein
MPQVILGIKAGPDLGRLEMFRDEGIFGHEFP